MENQKTLAVINFCYFTANFPYTFIADVWKDEGYLLEHINQKMLKIIAGKNYISPGDIMKFFFELDHENQVKLVEWIEANYHFSTEHKNQK